MENAWNLFKYNWSNSNSNSNSSSVGRGHNGNCTSTSNAWDILECPTTSTIVWSYDNPQNSFHHQDSTITAAASTTAIPATSTVRAKEGTAAHALIFSHHHQGNNSHYSSSTSSSSSHLYRRGGSHYHPDPHLMCLKLGKRHYFGDPAAPLADREALAGYSMSITKKAKPYYDAIAAAEHTAGLLGHSSASAAGVTVATPAVIPRCQVDGCHVALANAKDYHRRHKVCEMHSKTPKVVVLGIEQRFCQQCSRFHAVSEFDESKRSCRRRLAGHNERRRKSFQEHSVLRSHSQVNDKLMTYPGRHPYFTLNGECALSLLSSKKDPWISSADLATRCSAALSELIAENRAAILAQQLILDKDRHWHNHPAEDLSGSQNGSNSLLNCQQVATGSNSWEHVSEAEAHVTLDLMQAPNSAFNFLSMRGKSNEDDQECPELWSSFGGAHVV